MLRVRLWIHILDPEDEERQELAGEPVRIWEDSCFYWYALVL